jgi:hypothetical protein
MFDTPAGEPLPSLSAITRSASSIIKMVFLWSIKNGIIDGSDNISAIDGGTNKTCLCFINDVMYFMQVFIYSIDVVMGISVFINKIFSFFSLKSDDDIN